MKTYSNTQVSAIDCHIFITVLQQLSTISEPLNLWLRSSFQDLNGSVFGKITEQIQSDTVTYYAVKSYAISSSDHGLALFELNARCNLSKTQTNSAGTMDKKSQENMKSSRIRLPAT